MEICACSCGCKNEFKRDISVEIAVISVTCESYKQIICNECLERNHKQNSFSEYDSPITTLKKRLAKGEITKAEYEDLKSVLE